MRCLETWWRPSRKEGRPLISIVMLCYNHERFILEALEGVLAQDYSPLEIIIVDDCSPDDSAELVAARLLKLGDQSNISFIRNPVNKGLLGARETGFVASRGVFIVNTCDDDVMLPTMVTEMAEAWQSRKVSLVTVNAQYIDAASKPIGRTARDPNVPADDSFETLARDGANACCFGAGIGFEREIYQTFGMPPAHLNNIDIMWPYYACLLKGIHFISKPLLNYRVHGGNASLSLSAEKSQGAERLRIHEQIFYGHLAHAVTMLDELDRFSKINWTRYKKIAPKIMPLLNIQAIETAKKLVRNRAELYRQDAVRN